MLHNRKIWGILYGVVLAAFTVYVVLDTFVITRTYTIETPVTTAAPAVSTPSAEMAAHAPEKTDNGAAAVFSAEPLLTENSYTDANLSVTITQHREYDTDIYVAEVYISSPEYLKTALAEDSYGRNVTEKTSDMAERKGAILLSLIHI